MTPNLLDQLHEWNPQFSREVKGRLKPRTFWLTVIASGLLQLLLLIGFLLSLPSDLDYVHRYCTNSVNGSFPDCVKGASGHVVVNWQLWWLDLSQALIWALPFLLLIAGVYLLIEDLAKEEKRGTLNFIRLSPQTSQSILLGKVLGVPIVPYLVVGLALPLHLFSALSGGISFLSILGIYALVVVICAFCYVSSLLFALMGGYQGWAGAIAICGSYTAFYGFWQVSYQYSPQIFLGIQQWFWVNFEGQPLLGGLFVLVSLGVATFWLWQAVNRRFHSSNWTLLSKPQSYVITACFEVWLLGFAIQEFASPLPYLGLVLLMSFGWFLLLISLLTPQRQTLMDWARYRRERVSHSKHFWNRSTLRDLVVGEKSPALLAIALNLAITTTLLASWILTWQTRESTFALKGILLGGLFLMICAAIVQLLLFTNSSRRTLWAGSAVTSLILLPPAVLGFLQTSPWQSPVLWLFTIFAFAALEHASAMAVLLGFLGHLSILSLLVLRLGKQLQKAGESELKALLTGS